MGTEIRCATALELKVEVDGQDINRLKNCLVDTVYSLYLVLIAKSYNRLLGAGAVDPETKARVSVGIGQRKHTYKSANTFDV